MASIFKEVFSERNIVVMSITSFSMMSVNMLWSLWLSLYLLEIGAPISVVGLLAMVQSVCVILSQLPGGLMADMFGRKKVIVFGTGLRMFAPLIMFFGRTWQQVAPGMIVLAFSRLYSPAFNAIVAESLSSERRGAAFAAYSTVRSLPRIFMPVISGIFIDRLGIIKGVRIALIISMFVAIVGCVSRSLFLRETLLKRSTQKAIIKNNLSSKALSDLRQSITGSKTLFFMLLVSCIAGFAQKMVRPFLSIYVVNVIGLEPVQWGLLQTVFAIVSTSLLMIGGLISDKIGRVPLIILAKSISSIELLGLLFTQNFNHLIFFYFFLGISGGLSGGTLRSGSFMVGGPSWQALLADIIPSENRGKVLGLIETVTGLICLPASVVGGYIWEDLSPNMLLKMGFLIGASVIPIIGLCMKDPKVRER